MIGPVMELFEAYLATHPIPHSRPTLADSMVQNYSQSAIKSSRSRH